MSDSWKEVKMSPLTGVWKKLFPDLTDDSEWLKTLAEEVTAEMVETARKLELEGEPEEGTEFLQGQEKNLSR